MTITTVSFDAAINVNRTVEHIAINEKFLGVRVTQNGTLANPSKVAEKRFSYALAGSKREMVLTPENLKKLLAGNGYKTEDLIPVSAEFLEDARTKGYVRAGEMHASEFSYDKPTMFERLAMGESLRMVKFDVSSHMLFDHNGKVLPTGLYYDYMRGYMGNGNYDLKKSITILNLLDAQNVYTLDTMPLAIKSVPYYNTSSGCSSFLEFVYGPTQEQMEAVWVLAQTMNKQYPSIPKVIYSR